MLKPITEEVVLYRAPYYIQCCFCGMLIFAETREAVVLHAQREDWRFLAKTGCYVCGNCKEIWKEFIEQIEKEA